MREARAELVARRTRIEAARAIPHRPPVGSAQQRYLVARGADSRRGRGCSFSGAHSGMKMLGSSLTARIRASGHGRCGWRRRNASRSGPRRRPRHRASSRIPGWARNFRVRRKPARAERRQRGQRETGTSSTSTARRNSRAAPRTRSSPRARRPAGLRELHALRVPPEQRHADLLLESSHVIADRRRRGCPSSAAPCAKLPRRAAASNARIEAREGSL